MRGAHPFCPPDAFRRVHFCPEKSGLSVVRIGSRPTSKRSTPKEKRLRTWMTVKEQKRPWYGQHGVNNQHGKFRYGNEAATAARA
jgi:hypothetical protein